MTPLLSSPFTRQALISGIPSVLVSGLLPLLAFAAGFGQAALGALFMLIRLGLVAGGFLSARWLERRPPHLVGTLAELANAALAAGLLLAAWSGSLPAFLALGFCRGILGGTILSLRFAWLRQLPGFPQASRLNLLMSTLTQAGYALVGLLLVTVPSPRVAVAALALDAFSSLAGARIFHGMRDLDVPSLPAQPGGWRQLKTLAATPARRLLLAAETFACLATGGANILLVKYGAQVFSSHGGYGTSLAVYGLCCLAVGLWIQGRLAQGRGLRPAAMVAPPACLAAAFLVLSLTSSGAVRGGCAALVFLLFPLISLQFQHGWFRLSTPEDSPRVAASRTFLTQLLFAAGEGAYGLLGDDSLPRAACAAAAALGLLAFIRGPRTGRGML